MFMFLKRLWLKDEVEQYNKLLKYLVKGLDDLLTILKNPQEFLKVDDIYHIKVFTQTMIHHTYIQVGIPIGEKEKMKT